MELVALDLKRSGKFIARTLSYEGVEFRRVRLTKWKSHVLLRL